jgi:integrase
MTEPTARRQRRRTLTDKMVAALARKRKRYTLPDPEQRGMYVRVPPQGPCVYAAVCRDPYQRQVWATIGSADVIPIDEAREKAREAIRRIKEGKPAFEPPPMRPESFQSVAEGWLKRYVAAKKLRSQADIEHRLRKHVYPHWGERDFTSLRRSDVAALLDHIEDHHGPHQADYVLAIVRNISNWYASRNDDYLSPFTRGMRRVDPKAAKRSRILTDGELKRIWKAAEGAGTFGAFIRLALLTAQRRSALIRMRWSDLEGDVWHIPEEPRAKSTGGDLKLPAAAIEIIRAQPKFASSPYVFAGRSHGPFNGFAKAKTALDNASGVSGWRIHDLRRSSRSLMSRAGAQPHVAERVMGHVIPGIEGTYDRYRYDAEKAAALAKLARLIARIVHPPEDKVVVPFPAGAVPA